MFSPVIAASVALFALLGCGRTGPEAPPDTTPPTISAISPANGQNNVLVSDPITVIFSEEMDASTINNQTLSLTQGGTPVPGSVSYSAKKAVFTPDANLKPGSVHTLTVSVGVKDLAGNAMVAPFFCTFWTADAASKYTVTPSAGANGTISPNSPQQAGYNATLTFTVMPNSGYSISSVTGCGGTLAGNTYTTGPVTADCTVAASFSVTAPTTHRITSTAGANGSITPSGTVVVTDGGSQTFTMAPNTGYQVAAVLVDGTSAGAVTSYRFSNVTANHTISVSFSAVTPATHTITASAGANGSIMPSGAVAVTDGGSQTFTITPAAGYQVATLLVDGTSISPVTSYRFSNVTADHTISAAFAAVFVITTTGGPGGTISCTPSTVIYGSNSTCTITPDPNFIIADVTVDGTSMGSPSSIDLVYVTSNHTVSASFSSNTIL